MEIWADIVGYGDNYQASNLGNIKSKERFVEKYSWMAKAVIKQKYKERILNPTKSDKYGHLVVHLGNKKQKWNLFVHRLVLEAFIGKCPDGMECCHNNGIASDNRLENLRWDTHSENNLDRKKHGKYLKGKDHPMYGKSMPEELKKRLLEINIGKKASEATKRKMSESQKKRWLNVSQ